MENLEKRVKVLEDKIKILEETLEMLKDMNLSKEMNDAINTKLKILKFIELANALDEADKIDVQKEREQVIIQQKYKKQIDEKIFQTIEKDKILLSSYENTIIDETLFRYSMYETYDYLFDEFPELANELTQSERNGITITGYDGFFNMPIVIPENIDGFDVVSIDGFFNTEVETITLPKSIKMIDEEAFGWCKNLVDINLPSGLLYLAMGCFEKSGLKRVIIPDSVKCLEEDCFIECIDLEYVSLGNNVSFIKNRAFEKCISLKSIELPDKLEYIGSYCFNETSIKLFILPEGLKSISSSAFGDVYETSQKYITCVFLGKDTNIELDSKAKSYFGNVKQIYCLPGSKALLFARQNGIPVRHINEFKKEDYYNE